MNMKSFSEDFPYPLIVLDETDSTNRYIIQYCEEQTATVPEFTTVVSDFQTAGKGQRGNSWEAEGGKNLLFSYVLYPLFLEARRQFLLSQIASLAVKEALDKLVDGISIKWPNDVYWHDKKICGMLIENDLQGHFIGRCIPGIGINVNQEVFRSDAPNPVSLKQITGQEHDRAALLLDVLRIADGYYRRLCDGGQEAADEIARRYAQALYRRDGFYPYRDAGGRFMARLVKVEPDGRFVLLDEEGRLRSYLFKEMEYLIEG